MLRQTELVRVVQRLSFCHSMDAVMAVLGEAARAASDEELEILQALGDSATMAIANVQLIEELKDASRRKERQIEQLTRMVDGLLELHGSTLEAASDGPGQGSEFTIHLPQKQELPALSESAAPTRPPEGHLRVLIVEDNQDSAESLRMLLEVCGYEVTLATTGPDGVEAAKTGRPDVVLCDIGLPGMDGFEVASTLRASPETAATRLIAVTGYGREEDRRRALEAGFDAHLVKPVDPEKLLGHLRAPAGV